MSCTTCLHFLVPILVLLYNGPRYSQSLASSNFFRARKSTRSDSARGFGKNLSGSSNPTFVVDQSDNIKRFLEFLEKEEFEAIDNTEIGISNYGLRGIYAKEKLNSGDYICAVPFISTLLINEDLQPEEISPGQVLSSGRLENGQNLLEMFVGVEKWKPYFDCLPMTVDDPQFDPTPDFWDDETIEKLEVPYVVDEMISRKHTLQLFSQEQGIDFRALQHASWLVRTRAFTSYRKVRNTDGSRSILSRTVLIPYLDFLNHDEQPNAELEVVETKEYDESFYALVAKRTILPGEQVTISYGAGEETSVDLYCKYGFLPISNQNDKKLINLDIPWSTDLVNDEISLKHAVGPYRNVLQFRIHLKRLGQQKPK